MFIFVQHELLRWFCCNTCFVNLTCRGPSSGARGKVVLVFEENPWSKVGVRFDKPIPDGVDLGGRCEAGYGFFCNGKFYCHTIFTSLDLIRCLIIFIIFYCYMLNLSFSLSLVSDLRSDGPSVEELDKLLINTLFEVDFLPCSKQLIPFRFSWGFLI